MLTASMVGCSWCLDFGYYEANNRDLDMDKAREVPRWRESDLFTPLERDVLEYAEAMAATPTAVTDELSERLQAQLGVPALIELTAYIGMANLVDPHELRRSASSRRASRRRAASGRWPSRRGP